MAENKTGLSRMTSADVRMSMERVTTPRPVWTHHLEFLLSVIGYAVGLGNVWRFPYLCYKHGGGSFLIAYHLTLFLVGIPLFYLELGLGQFSSQGPTGVYRFSPFFRGVGYTTALLSAVVLIYSNVIVAWAFFYLFASMSSELPWARCDPSWSTIYCMSTEDMQSLNDTVLVRKGAYSLWVSKSELVSPSEEYFYRRVLALSSSIDEFAGLGYPLPLCMLLAWLIVFLVLINGISSLGKVCTSLSFLVLINGITSLGKTAYLTTIFPYVLLTIILVRVSLLEGAYEGVRHYLRVDVDELKDPTTWTSAATQIFFSLGLSVGGLIAMASHNEFHNNCFRDAVLVPLINCMTSFYAGFAIFSVLGYMAKKRHLAVGDVATNDHGPGMAFVIYPEALTTFPCAPLWSILFFLMIILLGLSTMFSLVESILVAVKDELEGVFQQRTYRKDFAGRVLICCCCYLLGLLVLPRGGFYLFHIIDTFCGSAPLLLIGLANCIAVVYVYGHRNLCDDLEMMVGRKPLVVRWYLAACWCVVIPLYLIALLVLLDVGYKWPSMDGVSFPKWAVTLGLLIPCLCFSCVPLWWLYIIITGRLKGLKKSLKPSKNWGPLMSKDRTGRYRLADTSPPELVMRLSRQEGEI